MTTVNNHRIVKNHSSSVGAIEVTGNERSTLKHVSEDKVVVDEEIDSIEGEDDVDAVFNAALMNSVIDTGGPGKNTGGEMSPNSKSQCGLRKRRRPEHDGKDGVVQLGSSDPASSGSFVEREPNFGSTLSSNLSRNPLATEHQKKQIIVQIPERPPVIASLPIPTIQPSMGKIPTTNYVQIKSVPKPSTTGGTGLGNSHTGIKPKLFTPPPLTLRTTVPPPLVIQPQSMAIVPNIAPGTNKNMVKKAPRKRQGKSRQIKTNISKAATRDGRLLGSVPNPLTISTPPSMTKSSLNQTAIVNRRRDGTLHVPSGSRPLRVPCPLPQDPLNSKEIKLPDNTVSYAPMLESAKSVHPAQNRPRGFSVDLDPSTFDFSDLSSLPGMHAENNYNSNHKTSESHQADDLPIFQGRDRAFSFEVFNFTGGDDLLPNPVVSSSVLQPPALAPVSTEAPMRRPRGDSIIFDPSSFQDGGIHEKNALEKARLKELLPVAPPKQQQFLPHPVTQMRASVPIVPLQHFSASGAYAISRSSKTAPMRLKKGTTSVVNTNPTFMRRSLPHPVTSFALNTATMKPRTKGTSGHRIMSKQNLLKNSTQIATLPSSLCVGVSSNGQSPPTFQLELLNKDGRIGIYLPEARRQRIARFHAKRKMRIWRKRIKYDCRKKLADSRPRIKGRFVKRADMD